MITPLLVLLQQNPDAHYGGGTASGLKAGATTDFAGKLFRFLLTDVPQWVQIAGIIVGGPIALIVAWQAWKNRLRIWAWFNERSRIYKLGIVASLGFVALIGGFVGLYNYNYVMHKNDFCQSCHIMDTAWNRFQVSAHKDLQCHACHRQPLWVSSKELFWWVLERRMAVPTHDKVPTTVCSECHVRPKTDSSRTNVLMTAGHVLHMKSDSSALKNVQCVSCHGRDFHLFRPNNATCSQGGCHEGKVVKLGAMSGAKFLHCTTCHDFRTRVQAGANRADVKQAVAPKSLGCSACHEMAEKVLKWNLAADPHKGSCGSCHNPHKQEKPVEAYKSCASAQCHASADTLTAFHRGLGTHRLDDCGACHQAHSWKVKGTDCLACHKTIYQNKPAAVRRLGGGPPDSATAFVPEPEPQGAPTAAAVRKTTDSTFLHSRHKDIGCADCHTTTGETHGAVKLSAPKDCLSCHHADKQKAQCTACHRTASLAQKPQAVTFSVTARKTAPVTRSLGFAHARHVKLDCAKCHASNDKRTPTVTTCTGCHTDHHQPVRDCVSCHAGAKSGHDRTIHDDCSTCHSPTRFTLTSTSGRPFCLTCHETQRNHYTAGECATCHVIPSHATQRGGGGR